jgi:hypothetical protein
MTEWCNNIEKELSSEIKNLESIVRGKKQKISIQKCQRKKKES